MSRYKQADLERLSLISVDQRESRVTPSNFAKPLQAGSSLSQFIDALPDVLKAAELRSFVADLVGIRHADGRIIAMIGGHVVKTGLAPLICDAVKRGLIDGVAMNSAAMIHDVESTLFQHTSEDVAEGLRDGTFGMARETGEFINGAILKAFRDDSDRRGLGETIGDALLRQGAADASILATAVRNDVPVTVHVAIGADIIHQQPSMNGAATGELTFRDFKVLAAELQEMQPRGAAVNFGSAVILPEVFLKALTVARNISGAALEIVTANFDMISHYRPSENVVRRPTLHGGQGYSFIGHHEIMIPLLFAMLKEKLNEQDRGSQ